MATIASHMLVNLGLDIFILLLSRLCALVCSPRTAPAQPSDSSCTVACTGRIPWPTHCWARWTACSRSSSLQCGRHLLQALKLPLQFVELSHACKKSIANLSLGSLVLSLHSGRALSLCLILGTGALRPST